jgi:AcrR family transcriptional regulator
VAPNLVDPVDPPRRGRPRSEKSQQAILAAAGGLLREQGLSGMSMEAVAVRAGASKATIYRWWPSKELLALDALVSEWRTGFPGDQDTGSLSGDLTALMHTWVRALQVRSYGPIIAGLVDRAQADPEFGRAYRAQFVEPRRAQARASFDRAIDRGEVPADTDVDVALDMLYGPVYHRVLHGHLPVTDEFGQTVVDNIVAAVTARR